MNKEEAQSEKILYKDPNVQISDKSVKVHKFYFPQDSGNEILFKDINKLALKEMDQMDEALGVHPSFFNDFDKRKEQNRNMYIEMAVQDESVRLCFAPDDPLKVLKLIEQKWQQNKIKEEGQSPKALQENTLYTNVEVTAQKIQQVMEHLKKSEEGDEYKAEKKRNIESNKTVEPQEGQTPKKKVKQTENVQNLKKSSEQNKNPDVEVK